MLRKLLEFLKSKFNKFRENTPEYIAITITFWAFFVVMIILAIMRLFGFGYWHIDYEEQEYNEVIAAIIMAALKYIEAIFIGLSLFNIKWYFTFLIAAVYVGIIGIFENLTIEFIGDCLYILVLSFVLNHKVRLKSLLYAGVYLAVLIAYQALMMFARYDIDLSYKFNYTMQVLSVFDYKFFIITLFLFIKRRKICLKTKRNSLSVPKSTNPSSGEPADASYSGATTPHSTKQ